jgi:nucleoside-diphosphate-sugar epimerase
VTMKIAVFGSTGQTGRLVVQEALRRGDEVTVLVREPHRVLIDHPRLTVLAGNPTSSADVERCVKGADAVIHCLGIGGKGTGARTTLVSDSVKAVLESMKSHNVSRIVSMSVIGAGGSGPLIANRIVIPLFFRWLLPIIEDKDRVEAALRESEAEWICVRFPSIIDGPVKPLRISADGRGIGLSITAISAARFLLEQATSSEHLRTTPSVSN